jgi:hypothetical protein
MSSGLRKPQIVPTSPAVSDSAQGGLGSPFPQAASIVARVRRTRGAYRRDLTLRTRVPYPGRQMEPTHRFFADAGSLLANNPPGEGVPLFLPGGLFAMVARGIRQSVWSDLP